MGTKKSSLQLPSSHLRIAARQSDLARLQAETVAAHIQEKFPNLKIELNFRASLGDQNQHDPLWKMPEKGVFTEDFYSDLVNEKVDIVVHSWKDLPIESKPDTRIVATMKRADQRDLFLFKRSHKKSVQESGCLKVLTSSPRRSYNLESFFKNYFPYKIRQTQFLNVRGNIPTRLKKLFSEDVDGLIVAKAALDRLLSTNDSQYLNVQNEMSALLKECQWMCLPLSENPSAAAQGALAIEAKNNSPWLEMLAEIHDEQTFKSVECERKILAHYGGGCHQKIGVSVLARTFGELQFLRGLTDQGEVLDSIRLISSEEFPKAAHREKIYPDPASLTQQNLFQREKKTVSQIGDALKDSFLWVTREDALPDDFRPDTHQILWTSGLKTWQKIAARGIWVNGSAESLGESEDSRIDVIVQASSSGEALSAQRASPIAWTKLTHETGFANPNMKIVLTYALRPQAACSNLDLGQKTHFYWSSGSNFDFCTERFPEIRNAWHFCGPGHTFDHLKKCLGSHAKLRICLNYEDWLQKVL